MKHTHFFNLFAFVALSLIFVACDSDDDNNTTPPPSDEEVITDLVLTFTDPESVLPTRSFTWSDPDGPGGNPPTIDAIAVEQGVWIVTIEVLDASNPNDIEDITEEIEEEDDEHQFFFERLNGAENSISTIVYNDFDADMKPVGLRTTWVVSAPATGDESVRITLIHDGNKSAPGASDGVLSSEVGGEIDIEVVFPFSTL